MPQPKRPLMSKEQMLDYAYRRLEGINNDLCRLELVDPRCQDQMTIVMLYEEQDFFQLVISLLG